MSSTQFARFTGARGLPFPTSGQGQGPGVCKSCGCDSAACGCGCRQCRKEAKEITVTGDAKAGGRGAVGSLLGAHLVGAGDSSAAGTTNFNAATPVTAFVGGGCCVHISLEYAPVAATAPSTVAVIVRDTEGTLLAWEKLDPPGTHYQIKENVVTTKPGATILLFAVNATVRARWCEVFSC